MISRPAVVVHDLDHARDALSVKRPVLLLSARGAALYAGEAWWMSLIGEALARHPGCDALDVLDCADAPGRALAALRIGQKRLILDPSCPAFAAVAACAGTLAAAVLGDRPPALDLAEPGATRRLDAWLAGGGR
jgi:hypothetical protein